MGQQATHIARITKDTIVVITGSTYSFTVDTPEDQGWVSTKPAADKLLPELASKDGSAQTYQLIDKQGAVKKEGEIADGDRLIVTAADGKTTRAYHIALQPMALSGRLTIAQPAMTAGSTRSLVLFFTAGQRSPDAAVRIYLPAGIEATTVNTTVNVIGRGDVALKDLATQSIGRVGTHYAYSSVGNVTIAKQSNGGSLLSFTHLDLRPANGPDLRIMINKVSLPKAGSYIFSASYTTAQPAVLTSPGTGGETAVLEVSRTIADFARVIDKAPYHEQPGAYTSAGFSWSPVKTATGIRLMQSLDKGKTWTASAATINAQGALATVSGLTPGKLYAFRLSVGAGDHKGFSNPAYFYSGKLDIKRFGAGGEDKQDNTRQVNEAIEWLDSIGGGTLLFSPGVYAVRTVHLKSNICLYVEKGATIKALKGTDAPEATWFSDKKYRSGLSPTDPGPYTDPGNYLTKEDVGHHYFRNAMFFGERLDNVKIIGNGLITGDGNLVTGDRVMNNAPDNRGDKMFTFKLCTHLEIGGISRQEDLWYDSTADQPYYMVKNGAASPGTGNMLHIDRAGHFALLAAGTDDIYVHDTWFGQASTSNARDIYDFMECNNVIVTNIFSKASGDDIIKPGSDCALGFTRPAKNYKIRNVIGDTNCNLFQIGSETADDIMDVHVDNIYILGANKAGFSISTNDGAHIKDVHLNCGHTGSIHSRSKMYRSFTPFFISISNRGRVLGADVGKYSFTENGEQHNELLVKNVNIGRVENIILNGIDVSEVYAGSSYGGNRWKAYDGSQRRATPIIAGYSLPATVEGGLDFTLPDGRHTGYISNIVFNDVHVLVKGGNPPTDTIATPPELGVGQYNASNLKVQPSYGIWARHVTGLTVTACSFNYEKRDSRYVLFLDDVEGANISGIKAVRAKDNELVIKLHRSSAVKVSNIVYYDDQWGQSPANLFVINPVR
jgi:polygalacturonase